MNITKETIKSTLRNIMKEESEYQTFFKKALEKSGKSIPSMSDEEKKEFFNKIDAAWNAKGEKNEELKGNQHKLDVDGDGEIEASDLAALRAGKKKDESVNEGIGTIALGVAGGLLLLKVLKFVLKKVVGAIGMNAPLPKEKLLEVVQTMVKTVIAQSSGKKINMLQLVALQSFLKDEINAGKITTVKQIMQVIDKASKIQPKEESVNEIQYKDAVAKFNDELIKHPMVKKVAQHYKKTPAEIVKVLQQRLSTKGNRGGDTKEVSIDFKDTTSGITIKHKMKFNESAGCGCGCGCGGSKMNEALKADPRKVYGGTGAKEGMVLVKQDGFKKILDLSKKNPSNVFIVSDDNYTNFGPFYVKNGKVAKYTVANPNYDFERNKVGSLKVPNDVILKFKIVESTNSVNEEKYTVIDPKGNSLGTGLQMQAASMAKKKGGEKAGYFVVPAKNALKARRALEKFKGDFKNPKLKDMMSDLFYENKSINEGRAFINAAKKAKAEGKTEFEFNGKTYPVTIKESVNEDANMNKKVKAFLDKGLKDLSKGRPNHHFAVMNVLMGALTDANFHSEAKKVPTLFGSKAKYEGDPMGKQDAIRIYEEMGETIASICKWDGKDIVDAIGFYVSMTIGRPVGEKIEKLVESINETIYLLNNKK
jgi:hypothetical protein